MAPWPSQDAHEPLSAARQEENEDDTADIEAELGIEVDRSDPGAQHAGLPGCLACDTGYWNIQWRCALSGSLLHPDSIRLLRGQHSKRQSSARCSSGVYDMLKTWV